MSRSVPVGGVKWVALTKSYTEWLALPCLHVRGAADRCSSDTSQLSDIVSCQIVTTGVESENRLACDSPVQTDQTLSGISRNTNVAQWDESPMWLMWVRGWWWDSMGSGPHKIFSKVSYFIISNGYNNDRTVWTFLDSINVYLRISIVTRLTN